MYRARDTRLGCDVAITVLPQAFANDADRLARFEREARVLAALDHPHIGAIHRIEESDASSSSGVPIKALVLALIERETLADRIARAPLSIREALEYARQIASALEAAHDKSIVHRDLKPGVSDTVAAILDRDVNWSLLPEATPIAVRRLLQRCLAKESSRRLRDIGDAKLDLEDVNDTQPVALNVVPARTRRPMLWVVGAVAALAVALAV